MRTANVQMHTPLKALLWGAALLSCAFFPKAALADKPGLFPTYLDYAVYNEWVVKEIDAVTGKTNLTWEGGYEPTDDKDGDSLMNQEEFDGWQTTLNGRAGWYTCNSTLLGGDLHLGHGSNPQRFDTDCDGISDRYEAYAGTNPRSADTDGDKLKDPVEIFAGLSPLNDGFIYDNTDPLNPVRMTNAVTHEAMRTLWHPDMDIDGDGLTAKQELKKANELSFGATCPELGETRPHFPTEELLVPRWTNPFDCDTDSDWLLDSFERAWTGFNPVEAEALGDTFHRHTDADRDGLTNFREECLHPLLSHAWAGAYVTAQPWPFAKSKFKDVAGEDSFFVEKIGTRYGPDGGKMIKGRILEGTPGYLVQAQFNKLLDMAFYYQNSYDDKGVAKPVLTGIPGTVRWGPPKTYWTNPRPAIGAEDWDGDGLPDGWEVEHGLNPLSGMMSADNSEDEDTTVYLMFTGLGIDPSTALGDPDKDGLLNLEEYFGQDGYRVDLITGTGDETIPWVARPMNYQSQSTFEDYCHRYWNVNWFLLREGWQAPVGYDRMMGMDTVYSMSSYPGFFNPLVYTNIVTNWVNVISNTYQYDPIDPTIITNTIVTTNLEGKTGFTLLPAAGVPAFPVVHDMMALAKYYGSAFVATMGVGGFQPFSTAYSALYYCEPAGSEDGRYTPGVDSLWYSWNVPDVYTPPNTNMMPPVVGDLILSDPAGVLTNLVDGLPVTDNAPLMVPMPGKDTDSDGLPDAMEIQMDVARGKQPTSPVQSLNPMVARSAKIVTDTGSQSMFVDYAFYFTRDFTVEAWVYLDGDDPATGSFVKGYMPWGAGERRAYDLGVTNRVDGKVVDTVAYAGMHTLGGKWYQASSTRPLPRNRWIHLAATFSHGGSGEGNALSLYVDGTLAQSRQVVGETIGNYLLQNWGSGGTIAFATGSGFANRLWIDEMRIWGVERSPAEVSADRGILQEGRQERVIDSQALSGVLLAYYNFDDGGDVAVDGRHRVYSSLHDFKYPGAGNVPNRSFHEYFYPDRAYALPTTNFGGGFVFDAGRTAPVSGALDSQRGELDSDGDGLPDSWEIVHEMNPFAWFTQPHLQIPLYDPAWAMVASAEVLIKRSGFTFSSSADGGLSWVTATCPGVVNTINGEVVVTLCPNTVLIGDYTTTTNTTVEGTNTTTVLNTTTNWQILSGQVSGFIDDGETWWVSKGGVAVSQVGTTGKMLSDSDGDVDADGLNNQQEYWARTNPRKFDTDENGIPDGDEDFDGDGLINRQEIRNNARPDLVDTDDDGMTDTAEVGNSTTASDSTSPKQSLAAYFTGKPGSWLEILDRSGYSQSSWTLEAKVLPARVDFLADGQGAPVFRRAVEDVTNGYALANYELRVVRDGAALYPEARFVYKTTKGIGIPIAVRGTNALPVSATYAATSVTHLAATYDGVGKTFTLYVDGQAAGSRKDLNISAPATGEGPASTLRIGERFHGFVDELRLWSGARAQTLVAASMDQVLEGRETGLQAYFNFDDGGWPVLTSNTWATARMTNLLYSVRPAKPGDADLRDGDTWVTGSSVFVNESGAYKAFTNAVGPVFDGVGIVTNAGLPTAVAPGAFGWNHAENMLYRYNGTNWLRWGKGRQWLADARAILKAKINVLDDMLAHDPTPGDLFACPPAGVVYIYNGVSEDGSTVELTADPLLDGHRFYLPSLESIVEWRTNIAQLVTVASAASESNLFIRIQSEGMAYKSEDKVWKRWGFVPSTEDYTVPLDWQTGWAAAAKMSGVVEFYRVVAAQTNYVPSGGKDTDGDGLPDSWEIRYGLNYQDGGFGGVTSGSGVDLDGDGYVDPVYAPADFINGAWGDPDGDGLNNRAEFLAGTNPFEFDTDGDGVGDYDSPQTGASYGSLYMDGDDIPDGWESLFPSACSPLRYDANLDPDGDGWDNYSEYMAYYLTHSANVFTVTTNQDGTVSSNWTSGSGYSIPYCVPNDPRSYPKPQMKFQFKTDCPEVSGTLRIWAYSSPEMNCPDAMTSMTLAAPIRDGNSLSLTDFMDGGHLRQGKIYFIAFIDVNNNGQWDDPEPMGFGEYTPENISWGEATVEIALREKANGFARIGWTGAASSDTNASATSSYSVRLKKDGFVVYDITRGGCSANRNYLHEFDFRNASGLNVGMAAGPMYGNYAWEVRNAKNVLLFTGTNNVDYPATLSAPTVLNPIGTVLHAKEKLRMTLDPATAQIQILIANSISGATVLDTTCYAPYIDRLGRAEMDLPALAGWGAFTNGSYRLQVRAFNPRASATSAEVSFTVDLKAPDKGGAGMITGRIGYFGWSTNASIVVEAFENSGFDQRPVAKAKADANFNYKLMGLPIGSYFLRAFQDQNGNGQLDAGEAWGMVKGAPATMHSITWVQATISRRGGQSAASATSLYATDYSTQRIEVKSAAQKSGNDLVIHDADSDYDGLPDVWEYNKAGNLTSMSRFTDLDADLLPDSEEFRRGTDPLQKDTDGDGLTDGEEVNTHGTNPLMADSDADGLADGVEVRRVPPTDPLNPDSDFDGVPDGAEVNTYGTDPLKADTDGDGMPDGFEIGHALNPLSPADAAGDKDGDGLPNLREYQWNTNPNLKDTDQDGLEDGPETAYDGDPSGYFPYPVGADLNAANPDTDMDGYLDGHDISVDRTDPRYAAWVLARIFYEDAGGLRTFKGEADVAGGDPLDPDKPQVLPPLPEAPVRFTAKPLQVGATDVRLAFQVTEGESANVVIESTTNLKSGVWNLETQTNISKAGSFTNLVPASPGSPVKFFRIRFAP